MSQMLVLMISVLRALLIPAFLTVNSYGYWQVYLFYTGYVGLFAIGYNDGIYLQYGACNYDQLPHKLIRSSNLLFTAILLIFIVISEVIIFSTINDVNTRGAIAFAATNILSVGLIGVFTYIYQTTNQFKKYSFFLVLDKIILLLAVLFIMMIDKPNYKIIIAVDIISKLIVLSLILLKTKELCFGKLAPLADSFKFLSANIRVGIKLMVANLMSMLLIGIGRFIVQAYGDISEFAIYSFGITITGFVLIFISTFSMVLYPTLKRFSEDRYQLLFQQINLSLKLMSGVVFISYFPICLFVSYYYPQYSDVLVYLNLFVAIVYLESKIGLLYNTFYKILRKEKVLLFTNMICVGLFIITAFTAFFYNRHVWIIALSTFIVMFIRSCISEHYLNKKLNVSLDRNTVLEVILLITFLITTTFCDFKIAFAVVSTLFAINIVINYKFIKSTIIKILQ